MRKSQFVALLILGASILSPFPTTTNAQRPLQEPFELKLKKGQANYHGTIEEEPVERYQDKKSFKVFTIDLEQGRTYQFDHISKAFQAFLYLEDPEGNLVEENSSPDVGQDCRLVFRADKTGTYRLIATSAGGFRTGEFWLSVRSARTLKSPPAWFKKLDKDGDGQVTLREWLAGGKELAEFREYDLNGDGVITTEEILRYLQGPFELRLKNGQANYHGTIEEEPVERYQGKKSFKIFTIDLEQGKTYQFDHISPAFQAFLYLEDPDGNLVEENSSPDVGQNSRLVFRADTTGTYRLIATSAGGFRTGDFSLTVRSGRILKDLPTWFKQLDRSGDGQITLQEWLEGGKEFGEFRQYDLNGDGMVTAEEVLRYLQVQLDLKLKEKPPELKLKNGQVNYKGTIEEEPVERYQGKKSFKIFTIELEKEKIYQFDHISKAFQAFLYLEDPEGNLLMENSSPDVGANSRLIYQADMSGTYRLIVTSQGGFRTGDFSLSVRSGRTLKSPPSWFKKLDKDGDGQVTLQEWLEGGNDFDDFCDYDLNGDGVITAEEVLRYLQEPSELRLEHGRATYDGTIEEEADEYRGKKSFKVFTIDLEAGKTYQIDHLSKVFAAYLYLEDSEGNLLMENSARLVFHAEETGTYRLIATSQGGFRTGNFSLTVRADRIEKGPPPWFNKLDKDGNGQVTLREWLEGGGEPEEFREYDLNGDGVITAEEVLRYLHGPGELKLKNGAAIYYSTIEQTGDEYRGKKSFRIFTIELERGKTYQIEHTSKAFHAFLFLEDPEGNPLAENVSPEEGKYARIVFRAETTGAYRIVATSGAGVRTGEFVLSVRSGRLLEDLPPWFAEISKGEAEIFLCDWRSAGRRDVEFFAMDRNEDGIVTEEEVLYFIKNSLLRALQLRLVEPLPDPGSLAQYAGKFGTKLAIKVTGRTGEGGVWGTEVYTLDSALAVAAVHAGLLQPGETAIVMVEIIDPPDSFEGSTHDGVTTQSFDEFPAGAYRFVILK